MINAGAILNTATRGETMRNVAYNTLVRDYALIRPLGKTSDVRNCKATNLVSVQTLDLLLQIVLCSEALE